MLPSAYYIQHCQNHSLSVDPIQQECLKHFDRLWNEIKTGPQSSHSMWGKLFGRKTVPPINGIYLWGGVGRGKTMLMDIFYASINIERKQRRHFHHFMLQIHQALKMHKKIRDPLNLIANKIARRTRLLCLDEFHVNDIADAMLLHGLFKALFAENVVLVTTSNFCPENLYADGLQRARFVPAIELVKRRTEVIELRGQTDYRLQTLQEDGTWHFPLGIDSERIMQHAFAALSNHALSEKHHVEINGRAIPVIAQSEDAIWFEFSSLCDTPRSQNDYIEIACRHHSVLISNLPMLDDRHNDAARRLITLLDIFYDHRVKLIVSAEVPISTIYRGQRLQFEFERAVSRLMEMQSNDYLVQPHRLPL
ncbi:MAG: AFG1 family ATPase [Gammaproteobacteria bacterium]|nr:AFG1 family ATPase [Gammaproteobacteria bacterium]